MTPLPSHQRMRGAIIAVLGTLLVALPWVFGVLCGGLILGIVLGVEPGITAAVVMCLWVVGLLLFSAKAGRYV